MIPDKLIDQLEAMMDYKVIRTNCKYTITFEEVPANIQLDPIPGDHEYILLQRALRFSAQNISMARITHRIAHRVHPCGMDVKKSGGYPACLHTQLLIDNTDVLGNATLSEDGKALTYDLDLEPGQSREVYTVGFEVRRASDMNYYGQSQPVTDLEISLVNKIGERLRIDGVTVYHPQNNNLRLDPYEPYHYYFPRAILPGQSFSVEWTMESPHAETT